MFYSHVSFTRDCFTNSPNQLLMDLCDLFSLIIWRRCPFLRHLKFSKSFRESFEKIKVDAPVWESSSLNVVMQEVRYGVSNQFVIMHIISWIFLLNRVWFLNAWHLVWTVVKILKYSEKHWGHLHFGIILLTEFHFHSGQVPFTRGEEAWTPDRLSDSLSRQR